MFRSKVFKMQEELILIDKLEDQLIDHPDASTQKQLDNSSLDETFQKKLNDRADKIAHSQRLGDDLGLGGTDNRASVANHQFLVTKNVLKYDYKDYGSLKDELNEWFTFHDFKALGGLEELKNDYGESLVELSKKIKGEKDELNSLQHGINEINNQSNLGVITTSLNVLVYYSLGKYGDCDTDSEQINSIRENNKSLFALGTFEMIITKIQVFMKQITDLVMSETLTDFSLDHWSNYFKLLTLLYVMINCSLQNDDSPDLLVMRRILSEKDLLSSICEFIEFWKFHPHSHYRIRYLIMIFWKLILLEFGDSNHLKSCDEFLLNHHGIQNKSNQTDKLTCSPLDYFTFRENLMDRYPLFDEMNSFSKDPSDYKQFDKVMKEMDGLSLSTNSSSSSIDEDYKNVMALNTQSTSLSNYIANPRPNRSHSVLSQLPAQIVHISTPVPSPPSTPSGFMSGGEKVRKLYQLNQGMPFIYPVSEDVQIPYAIEEADKILKNSVYDSYSNKRLWGERQKFAAQERGYVNEYEIESSELKLDEFDYDQAQLLKKYPKKELEIQSLIRIEKFYSKNLKRLANIIDVLINTIDSTKLNHNLSSIEAELNGDNSYYQHNQLKIDQTRKEEVDFILIQRLEVFRTKEIITKASLSIIMLLLKWFKINHIIKYYYLTTILFDHHFLNIIMDLLTSSFNDVNNQTPNKNGSDIEKMVYQNRLMNPQIVIPHFEFFNNCMGNDVKPYKFNLINKIKLSDLPVELDEHNNSNIANIETFNSNWCKIFSDALVIMNKVLTKNFTQRILTINELKPSEIFKMLVMNYSNPHLCQPIFKILKKLIPYQGRKWKSVNMDLISLIYLNCKLNLRDNWLSGKDLENDFNNSFDQEISLRALLQFYNLRKYPDQMECLGYQINNDFSGYPLNDDFDYF